MLKPGMFISDRYEIIDKVGSGGMADVYKARCHRLNRYVAIKVLKPEFSNDKSFVNKFRGEAQSAAGLSHPNIVNVYDVGDDGGLHYIVMELVEGITLKKFIEKKGKLEIKEAVGIAIQIAQGMEAAHANHIIHRDIKPQNIIISRDGKVKVTDFGIAKATTSNTITSNAMGSVHYLSPEQARGGYSDEKSDIYSLGVTLYEMLSGKVPFAGDNTVSVALLHIQGEAMPLRELNPDIPISLDKIVQKCMQKKPERRYLSASELIVDLKRSITNPNGDFVQLSPVAIATDSPTINISEDLAKIKMGSIEKENSDNMDNTMYNTMQNTNATIIPKEEEEEEGIDPADERMDKFAMIGNIALIVILFLVIIFLICWFLGIFRNNDKTPSQNEDLTPSVTISQENNTTPEPGTTSNADSFNMISVIGLTREDAETQLKAGRDALLIRIKEEYSDLYPEGRVVDQYPIANNQVSVDGTVILTISLGSEPFELPSLYGLTETQARTKLEDNNLKAKSEYISDNTVESGKVIKTDPERETMVISGDVVTLYISTGPDIEYVSVPDLINLTQSDAEDMLKSVGLSVGKVSKESSEKYKEGRVTYQSNSANQKVEKGSKIDITVSTGSDKKPEITDTPSKNVKYVGELVITDNPFDYIDESEATIMLELVQDGGATTIYEEYLSIMDFPLTVKNIEGESASNGVVYMYIDDVPVTLGGSKPATWTVEFKAVEE